MSELMPKPDSAEGLFDATGTELKLGDLLLNGQGRVWIVLPTPAAIAHERCALVREARRKGTVWTRTDAEPQYLRLHDTLRIAPQTLDLNQTANRHLFDRLFGQLVAPRLRAEAKARHQRADEHIRTVRKL